MGKLLTLHCIPVCTFVVLAGDIRYYVFPPRSQRPFFNLFSKYRFIQHNIKLRYNLWSVENTKMMVGATTTITTTTTTSSSFSAAATTAAAAAAAPPPPPLPASHLLPPSGLSALDAPPGYAGPGPQAGKGAGWLLVRKIAGAAAEMGYRPDEVRRVAGLVGQNLGSADTTTTTTTGRPGVQEGQVRQVLARLLEPRHSEKEEGLRVNSNEPVVLVDAWGGYGAQWEREALLSQIIGQLRRDYGIRPVRVYAGKDLAGVGGRHEGFSLSVLNVVNSELGGPSMVQLLDAPCADGAWNTVVVTKEDWEQSDGSVERTVELAMRNWDSRQAAPADADSADRGNTQQHPRYGQVEDIKDVVDQEAEDHAVRPDRDQQYQALAESAALDNGKTSVANIQAGKPLKGAPVKENDNDQDKPPEQDPSTTEGDITEAYKVVDEEEEDEMNVIENEIEEAMISEVGHVKENGDDIEAANIAKLNPSSDGGFEMVYHESTLIDMV